MMFSIMLGEVVDVILNGNVIDYDEEKIIGVICVEIMKENDFKDLFLK